ncbi:Branched-chain amino acid transport protein [Bowdeniella nasicola]|uniref:Branched-chain amino acid transport protein n=1 Tax=Bowdeniella nasicola TaxID=208480 RepID=A0A1H3VGG3_9ACTO|nr:AzlD domain-containing protein [Bowdeniella nasicola]SDZ73751.1 Branched-chain amino acid transport protein [Bowdeniella nasicola]
MSYLALAIAVTGGVTYLLRATPLVLMRKQIDSAWIRSFLFYVPWAVLTAMTIPAIFFATQSPLSASLGLIVAVSLALARRSLITVALGAAAAVWLVELVIG